MSVQTNYFYEFFKPQHQMQPRSSACAACDRIFNLNKRIGVIEKLQKSISAELDRNCHFATLLNGEGREKKAREVVLEACRYVTDISKSELNVEPVHSAECLISDINRFMANIEE